MGEPEHLNTIAEETPTVVEPVKADAAAGTAVEVVRAASEIVIVTAAPAGLTAVQKAAVAAVIGTMKETATSILADTSALAVTVLLGKLVKAVEGLSISGARLAGADKKAVVLEVGKQLITEVVPAEQRGIVLSIYELAAEPTLEAMVDVSRTLNVGGALANAVSANAVPAVSPAAAGGLLSACLSMCIKAAAAAPAAPAPAKAEAV